MKNTTSTWLALILAAGLATAGCLTAYANQAANQTNDAITQLAHAKISLTEAIAAAEHEHLGKASRAELETEKGTSVYAVEIVAANQQVYDVRVDAGNGKVLSSKLDKNDGENKNAQDDEKDDD